MLWRIFKQKQTLHKVARVYSARIRNTALLHIFLKYFPTVSNTTLSYSLQFDVEVAACLDSQERLACILLRWKNESFRGLFEGNAL